MPPLRALLASPHDLVGVYTQPDRPSGRGRKLTPSPVKEVAVDAVVYHPYANAVEVGSDGTVWFAGTEPLMVDDQYVHDLSNPDWYKEVPGLSDVEIAPELITTSSDIYRITATAQLSMLTIFSRIQSLYSKFPQLQPCD